MRLTMRERGTALVFFTGAVFLSVLSIRTYSPRFLASFSELERSKSVEVKIFGDVERPGLYRVEKGTPVEDALHLAIPFDKERLPKRYKRQKLEKNRTIRVKLTGRPSSK